MIQKGTAALIPLILIVGGLVVGAYFISTNTSFFPDAFFTQVGVPKSSIIKIATNSARLATPSASLKAASQSAKPSPLVVKSPVGTSAASPVAIGSIKPKQASPSASAKLGFPDQPQSDIEVTDEYISLTERDVQGVSHSPSFLDWLINVFL